MYQSQSFHTANYRGNQPGHDSYLRSDSQSTSAFSGAQNVGSQYRGMQKSFQPTGYVSSVYGQSKSKTFAPSQSQFSGSWNPQSFHTANYRGNQQGHDSYLRSDASQPSQSQYRSSIGAQTFKPSFTGASSFTSGISGIGQQQQSQMMQPQSFHTANYRGNQPGHDNYLRADSTQPSNMGTSGVGFASSMGSQSWGSSSFGGSSAGSSSMMGSAGFGASNLSTAGLGASNPSAASMGATSLSTAGMGASNLSAAGLGTSSQSTMSVNPLGSAQSYHTANYRGNQPGHDSSLRSDSSQPFQS